MKVVTWNVNGIRAREAQVLELFEAEAPEVVCLQEIKASPQDIPASLLDLPGYWSCFHGHKGYSGVSLHLRRSFFPAAPRFEHPPFDVDCRVVTTQVEDLLLASVYVPNGNRDLEEKEGFLDALEAWVAQAVGAGARVLLCGDLNIARLELDVHPKLRDPRAVGQTTDERARFERLLGQGLVDLHRQHAPDDDALFTWWAPWRQSRERNLGWRLDYQLVSPALARASRSIEARRSFGTSDHGPVLATYALPAFVAPDGPAAAALPAAGPARGPAQLAFKLP